MSCLYLTIKRDVKGVCIMLMHELTGMHHCQSPKIDNDIFPFDLLTNCENECVYKLCIQAVSLLNTHVAYC